MRLNWRFLGMSWGKDRAGKLYICIPPSHLEQFPCWMWKIPHVPVGRRVISIVGEGNPLGQWLHHCFAVEPAEWQTHLTPPAPAWRSVAGTPLVAERWQSSIDRQRCAPGYT